VFERFDDQAMAVVSLADAEARHLGHPAIGTGHLLLALIDDHVPQASGALQLALPPAEEMRRAIGALYAAGPGVTPDEQVFTEPALAAIRRAQELAISRGQEQVSVSDIATVLVDEDAGVLAVLGAVGVDPQALRVAVQSSGPDAGPPSATVSW